VLELERLFAEICNVQHAIAVNNGTTALVATLKMLEVPAGSTVVTSPFTFVATLNAAIEAGYNVRFADVDENSFNITADSIEACATDDVRVVMPVHLYGQCANMTQIMDMAGHRNWQVVEDAAQAHGAQHDGRPAGSFGAGCFSFYATKNITTGEGGIVTTNDDALADRLRVYRNQGMRQRYQYEMAGTNFRMTDIQAAVGIPQLRRIDFINAARHSNAQKLNELLGGVEGVITPTVDAGNSHVWHQYTVRITEQSRRSRDEVIDQLTRDEVGCGIYYPRLAHDYDCFRSNPGIQATDTPIAAKLVSQVVSLPVHQYLSDGELEAVADAVKRAVR
jgi:dTDP-4-amino-4,6-dideoxygalactose transaminase